MALRTTRRPSMQRSALEVDAGQESMQTYYHPNFLCLGLANHGINSCESSTTTPAVIYFPAGTYIISTSIINYYYTQLVGNPNAMPVLKATPGFQGLGLIDGNQYQPSGAQGWTSTNVFFRQLRNFVLDMTAIPASTAATGIHWATSQATSIQNVVIRMNQASNSQQQGIFIENGTSSLLIFSTCPFQWLIPYRLRRLVERHCDHRWSVWHEYRQPTI